MSMSKKLQQISECEGLTAVIHGGSDRVVVMWSLEDQDYTISFYKEHEYMPAYAHETATPETLEAKMRGLCPDLRKWRKFQYDTNQ